MNISGDRGGGVQKWRRDSQHRTNCLTRREILATVKIDNMISNLNLKQKHRNLSNRLLQCNVRQLLPLHIRFFIVTVCLMLLCWTSCSEWDGGWDIKCAIKSTIYFGVSLNIIPGSEATATLLDAMFPGIQTSHWKMILEIDSFFRAHYTGKILLASSALVGKGRIRRKWCFNCTSIALSAG